MKPSFLPYTPSMFRAESIQSGFGERKKERTNMFEENGEKRTKSKISWQKRK